jgi:hypothetical protein
VTTLCSCSGEPPGQRALLVQDLNGVAVATGRDESDRGTLLKTKAFGDAVTWHPDSADVCQRWLAADPTSPESTQKNSRRAPPDMRSSLECCLSK